MIVIDVGCANYEGARSVPELITRFAPDVIYGFDPMPDEVPVRSRKLVRSHKAAWTYAGTLGLHRDSTSSRTSATDRNWPQVECFDLAEFIESIPDDDIVLKLDCEGAEHVLLRHLHERGVDRRLMLCLVEWHGPPDETLELACPVEEW